MGIEDRDWYRRRRIDYEHGGLYNTDELDRRRKRSSNWLPLLLTLVAVSLVLFAKEKIDPQLLRKTGSTVSPVPPLVQHVPAQSSGQSLLLPEPATHSLPAPVGHSSEVISSSSSSQTVQYYTQHNSNMKYLTVEINDIPFEFMLDSGSTNVALNAVSMRKLGLPASMQKVNSRTAGGVVESYLFTCPTVKLGNMAVDNVTCIYVPTLDTNLLGASFLRNFTYSVDEQTQTITLIPREYRTYSADGALVPIEGSGSAEVDGKKYIYENDRIKEAKDKN
jgi:clan AA aspartic protease (TIGR02281 family)